MSTRRATTPSAFRGLGLDSAVLALFVVYMLVPLGATAAFGLSNGKGVDLHTYSQIFSDHNFWDTFLLSLELALGSTLLAIVLVTPTVYWVHLRLPQARVLMNILSLVPFAIPAVVMSLGLVEVYGTNNDLINVLSLGLVPLLSNDPFTIVNTPQLLICAYVIVSLPFVYRPIENSLRAVNTRVLTEAAYSLGCGWWRTLLTVVLPNILPGILSAALLTFSTVMGEFTLASLFNIFTFPIYLTQLGQADAREAASLSILSFAMTLICVLVLILFLRSRSRGADQAGELDIGVTK